jgi:hypothetical protein
VHTFKLWHYTSAEKHFTACSTQRCSRMLAKSCHNSHPLPTLHSVASSPNARKEEECSSYDPGLCYSTPFGTCSYACKEMYFTPPIPKHCANGSCHLGPWFLHTSRVCNLVFLFTCVSMEPSSISACIRRRSRRQPYATMTLLQQLQDIHPYMLQVSILRYVPRLVNVHQPFTHIYLLLNIA